MGWVVVTTEVDEVVGGDVVGSGVVVLVRVAVEVVVVAPVAVVVVAGALVGAAVVAIDVDVAGSDVELAGAAVTGGAGWVVVTDARGAVVDADAAAGVAAAASWVSADTASPPAAAPGCSCGSSCVTPSVAGVEAAPDVLDVSFTVAVISTRSSVVVDASVDVEVSARKSGMATVPASTSGEPLKQMRSSAQSAADGGAGSSRARSTTRAPALVSTSAPDAAMTTLNPTLRVRTATHCCSAWLVFATSRP